MAGGGGLFVPAALFQPVAHELFVEGGRADADAVLVLRPEAAGIWGEHFVHQGEGAVVVEAEFEFGVADNDAARLGVGGRFGVEGDGFVAHLGGEFGADKAFAFGKGDVFVVAAHFGFG